MFKWIICDDSGNYIKRFSKEENSIHTSPYAQESHFFDDKRAAERVINTMQKQGHDMTLMQARKACVVVSVL